MASTNVNCALFLEAAVPTSDCWAKMAMELPIAKVDAAFFPWRRHKPTVAGTEATRSPHVIIVSRPVIGTSITRETRGLFREIDAL